MIELLVVLAILAIGASVVAPAVPKRVTRANERIEIVIADARHRAIRDGVRVRATLRLKGDTVYVTALPDGIVLLDSAGTSRTIFPGAADAPN